MQVPRTARAGLIDFQRLVEQGTNEIAQHWREAMRADAAAPASESVKEPLLLDAVPFVLDQVLCFIESNESKIDPENICRVARRNRGKVREHFDVRQLVREYQLLREYTLLYLHEHVAQFSIRDRSGMTTTYRRAGLAMDQAMRETINAFVEEHTGQLRHVSRSDNLTGLYNHYTFNERLGEELTRAKRYENPLAIVLIDLDNFKSVNDTKGYQFGDRLLVGYAEWLQDELRQTDVVCRCGGDEFGVILPETKGADARLMMARLADAFGNFGSQESAPSSFGMSFGIAAHPEDGGAAMSMVKVADERLLLNKQRNKEEAFTALSAKLKANA
jgi:diguanylate cyclase (GGDEF)-like protein